MRESWIFFFFLRKKIKFSENDSGQEPEAEQDPEDWRREEGLGVLKEGENGTDTTGSGG